MWQTVRKERRLCIHEADSAKREEAYIMKLTVRKEGRPCSRL